MSTTRRHAILAAVGVVNMGVVAVVTPLYGATATADVFLVLLMIKAVVFVALYARSNWRQTAAGRAVMGLIACIATICAIGTLTLILGDYPGRPIVRIAAFWAVGLTLLNMVLSLIDSQRNSRRSDDRER